MSELDELRGDPTRDKWIPFLGKCLELGFITLEDHNKRTELLLGRLDQRALDSVLENLPWEDWNDAWEKGRKKGLYPKSEVLPDLARRRMTGMEIYLLLFAVTGWVLLICAMI